MPASCLPRKGRRRHVELVPVGIDLVVDGHDLARPIDQHRRIEPAALVLAVDRAHDVAVVFLRESRHGGDRRAGERFHDVVAAPGLGQDDEIGALRALGIDDRGNRLDACTCLEGKADHAHGFPDPGSGGNGLRGRMTRLRRQQEQPRYRRVGQYRAFLMCSSLRRTVVAWRRPERNTVAFTRGVRVRAVGAGPDSALARDMLRSWYVGSVRTDYVSCLG